MSIQILHPDILQNSQRDNLPVKKCVSKNVYAKGIAACSNSIFIWDSKQYESAWLNCSSRGELPIHVGCGEVFGSVFL